MFIYKKKRIVLIVLSAESLQFWKCGTLSMYNNDLFYWLCAPITVGLQENSDYNVQLPTSSYTGLHPLIHNDKQIIW